MPGPLEGIRVLDITQAVAGPVGTMLLGELGADVVKVEFPGIGDLTRMSGFAKGGVNSSVVNCNRGKRSIQVDMKSEAGRDVVLELAERSDVVVQAMRPGKIDRLGMGYEAVRSRNADVIYVSLSGYGPDGPYSDRAVFDPVLQALCGYVSLQVNPDIPFPDLMRTALIDKAVSWEIALSITAALFARERGRGGQHLDVAMIDVAIAFLWPDGGMADTMLDPEAATGTHLSRVMNMSETADGHVVYFAVLPHQVEALYDALGHPEWSTDERFSTQAARHSGNNNEVLGGLIADAFRTFTTAEIAARMHDRSVPCGHVVPIGEVPDDPQVRHNAVFGEWDHPTGGRIRSPRHATRFGGTPPRFLESAPLLNEHADEILAELGVDGSRREELRNAGVVP
ncbi:MAG: CoA transferase [Actinomycetota bacterium]